MIKLFLILSCLTLPACSHFSVGYATTLKLKCEVYDKTDYVKNGPEQKCGAVVETTVVSFK